MFKHRSLLFAIFIAVVLTAGIQVGRTQEARGGLQLDLAVQADNAAPVAEADGFTVDQRPRVPKRTTQAERDAVAQRAKAAQAASAAARRKAAAVPGREKAAVLPVLIPQQGGIPDYFGIYSNWANTKPLRKFVDTLPGLTSAGINNLLQYIPIGNPDIVTYPGSDYYEISLIEYSQKMHSDLAATRLRGYVQTNNGTDTAACVGACTALNNTLAPSPIQYLGPVIVATKDRPVRIKFTNNLPTGAAGKLFIPVDTTVMGAGPGPGVGSWAGDANVREFPDLICASTPSQSTPAPCYVENRATIHLHGGRTPWISDGTPHQWITPAGETTQYTKGESVFNVPDMPDPGPGAQTFYFTNQQSARMMFYHDHASGTTRLNVYVGEAAGYLITDDAEKALVASGVIPPASATIPLIIQDKTFVNETLVANPLDAIDPAGAPRPLVPAVLATDPTWNWGTGALTSNTRAPKDGDLWFPHVYVPAQNPYDMSGVNPWGRWAYGPWFWPPTNNVAFPPVDNPYYDPTCDPYDTVRFPLAQFPDGGYCEPNFMPGTPNLSWAGEAFMDTPMVNGTAYPKLTVEPKAYRFRILNAANDRFWNLQLYKADTSVPPGCPTCAANTEVKMVPAINPGTFPANWPADGRPGGVPDPTTVGPNFVQIASEGGFLPRPAVIPSRPVSWNADPTTFNFGNVSGGGLILGSAERADVIVDFTGLNGQTLILYNDAPAAFPAIDRRLDYYTGAPDMRDSGGSNTPQVGFGPNTRTIMQIVVGSSVTTPSVLDMTALNNAFAPALPLAPGAQPGVFAASQEPIIVGSRAYNGVYPGNPSFPGTWPNWGVVRIQDNTMAFETVAGPVIPAMPLQPKAMHDEMGAVYDEYGRMSAKLGSEVPFTGNLNQTFSPQNYVDPAHEIVTESISGSATLGDGTQVWKISHNGVDTHPIHFHIFDVQLINRVGWDGSIRLPDANELGWKDTIRISPLEDTIVALRPVAPRLPFGIPDSVRRLNPAMPTGATAAFSNLNPVTGQPMVPAVTNVPVSYGWEYVWHCHILAHEEADMMRPIVLNVARSLPTAPVLSRSGVTLPPVLSWTDATPVVDPNAPSNLGNPANEVGFRIERADVATNGTVGAYAQIGTALANIATYTDNTASSALSYRYRVVVYNQAGTATSNFLAVAAAPTVPSAPSGLTASPLAGPAVQLSWTDNSNNETGFLVQRASDATFTTGLISLPAVGPNITTTTGGTVTNGSTYFYRVYAVNGALQSLPSNVVSITVSTTLAAPSGLTATVQTGPLRVTLNWADNSATETGFTIQRANDAAFSSSLVIYTVGANITTYLNNTGLATGQTYFYRVRADGSGGTFSAWSNVVSVGPPAAPTALVASLSGTTSILLTWTDNSTNESGFNVERATVVGGVVGAYNAVSTRPAHAGVGPMTYTNNGLTVGVTYIYRVRATGALGNSGWVISNQITR
jgi:FtsP/CotA-like multicopper oxidase with cupredoxin domain